MATTDEPAIPEGWVMCPDCGGEGTFIAYGFCARCAPFPRVGLVPIDHTVGVIRCHYKIAGGHVHCHIYGPYSGKAGDLVFRVEEWEHFKSTNLGWYFVSDDDVAATVKAWQ